MGIYNTKNGRYTYVDIPATKQNHDILRDPKYIFDTRYTHPAIKKMSIHVNRECTIVINGIDEVLIKPNLGLQLSYEDIEVRSMTVKEDGVQFYAVIAY
jgi:hypothetical protein